MDYSLLDLIVVTVPFAFFHTLAGPHHYLPLVLLARLGRWSGVKTFHVVWLCGLGHLLSTVVAGLLAGYFLDFRPADYMDVESVRTWTAAGLLAALGLTHVALGLARREKARRFFDEHWMPKAAPWVLFAIFVVAPAAPLFYVIRYTDLSGLLSDIVAPAVLFEGTTVVTIVAVVAAFRAVFHPSEAKRATRTVHVAAGVLIFLSGAVIAWMGW